MKQPAPLKHGDLVTIISTARKISKEEVAPAVKKLKDWGLRVRLGENLFAEHHQYAGTDEQRAADFQAAADDPEVKAVLCARGGYGTVRIIDKIDFSRFLNSPKWVIGYSDVTVLHSHIHGLGVETLHATMPVNFPADGNENTALDSLRKALFEGKVEYHLPPHKFNRKGRAEGLTTGGNLSILYSLLGSPSDIDTSGKILFMEDLDEYLYHIDRMMMNMKRNGKFETPAGVIIGGMSDMNDNTIPFGKDAEEIISETLSDTGIPVAFGFPAGHIADNRAFFLGRKTKLEITEKGVWFKQ